METPSASGALLTVLKLVALKEIPARLNLAGLAGFLSSRETS